ncbi:hypothetical protein GCM10007973_31130 [Polymorphobacter multimanifer]|uniref:Uncharacterized protein n=1 Tax=Polymorphobacter multimanifer TaxID=1070431 RepID=A0A841LJN4_9SPHN|nr:hypothetical protein [Polymorphobacter multimanifer]MBB6229178.1 hypothetical protein [Polymorphobacter multimanifer]GGI92599.1 hypothetical protein GCM10007973_31130 [Polymorphobacter multimanifer]
MRSVHALAVLALSLGLAAAPPPDPVLQKVIAGARAVPPATITFERTSKTSARDAKGASETSTRVDRWDGKQLKRISTDGRPATPEEIAEQAKAIKGSPIPGYHRIADYLAGGARRLSEKPGQIVYRIDKLPKGSINMGGDRSDKFSADLAVDTSGTAPVATRVHIFAPKPFSIMLVAKIEKFDVVSDFAIAADGRPALARSVQQMAGAQFGKAGEQRTEAVFSPLK